MIDLSHLRQLAKDLSAVTVRGRVVQIQGPVIRAEMVGVGVGDYVRIKTRMSLTSQIEANTITAQVVGFSDNHALLTPLGSTTGIPPGSEVSLLSQGPTFIAGPHLLGAVVNSSGKIIQANSYPTHDNPVIANLPPDLVGVTATSPCPLSRQPIAHRFETGIRAIDCFVTIGEGQRLSLLAPPGVGKSTLMGMIARSSSAEVNVVGLIGERGREVQEFLEETLDRSTRQNTVVVVSTSDEPALARATAALTATRIAEYFRDHGLRVLLQIDSLTRLFRAYREIGIAAGETPVRRGYPASVYSMLPQLIERAGNSAKGSMTALYTVLLSSELDEDPMVEEIKGLTDGHIQLSQPLADRGHYPAIDVLSSLSRLQSKLVDRQLLNTLRQLRRLMARLRDDRELTLLSSGRPDPELETALRLDPLIDTLLRQGLTERTSFAETAAAVAAIAAEFESGRAIDQRTSTG